MFEKWETRFRDHWPHHYRDILDKMQSDLGMVVVSDTQNSDFGVKDPLMILQKSLRTPLKYQILVKAHQNSGNLAQYEFREDDIEKAVLNFAELIGGWQDKVSTDE